MSRNSGDLRPPLPWTASRCDRTLRQLTAYLAKLEKWHQDFKISQTTSDETDQDGSSEKSPTETSDDAYTTSDRK